MKRCSHCKVTKPTTEFYKNRSCKDGFGANCKRCANAAHRSSQRRLRGNAKKPKLLDVVAVIFQKHLLHNGGYVLRSQIENDLVIYGASDASRAPKRVARTVPGVIRWARRELDLHFLPITDAWLDMRESGQNFADLDRERESDRAILKMLVAGAGSALPSIGWAVARPTEQLYAFHLDQRAYSAKKAVEHVRKEGRTAVKVGAIGKMPALR